MCNLKGVKMPKVSVIIPVYNVGKYLSECLESVINQTLSDIEIICVNDGSTDNSLEILREYEKKDNRIIVFDKGNTGAGDSRNKGIDLAKGEYLKFIDADDFIPPNALELCYQNATKFDVDILIFHSFHIMPNGSFYKKVRVMDHVFNMKECPERAFNYFPSIHNKVYKTSFIKDNQIYFNNLPTCNDVFFAYFSALSANRIYTLDEVLYTWRGANPPNITSNRQKTAVCIVKAMENLKNKLIHEGIYEIFEKSFIESFNGHLNYELSKCTPFYKRKIFFSVLFSTYSLKRIVLKKILMPNKKILEFIFSVKNLENKTRKVITILGFKIKLKRRKNA